MPTILRILICSLSLAIAWAGFPSEIRRAVRAAESAAPFEMEDGQESDDDEKGGESDVDFSFGASHELFVSPSGRFIVVAPNPCIRHGSHCRAFLIRGPPVS